MDARLRAIGSPEAERMLGTAATANAQLAWAAHVESLDTDRWAALADLGAHPQRPLWASTGVKDPAYDPTRYVVDLVARGCVNTMPEATLLAVAAQGRIPDDSLTGTAPAAARTWADLTALGIDEAEVCALLESEGVSKFIDSWEQLRRTVTTAAGDVQP